MDLVAYCYAGFLALGGIAGFAAKRSVPSLAAGVSTGAVVAAVTHFRAPYQPLIVAAISGSLSVVMYRRFNRSGKFMPPGVIALASFAVLIVQAAHIARFGMKQE